ncbi:hypothetical protein ES703_09971 [subsurface metagenome]
MKCIPLAIAWSSVVAKQQEEYPDCLKEECAWWDSVGQRCVTLSIYQELRLLVGAVTMVADKIPPARE